MKVCFVWLVALATAALGVEAETTTEEQPDVVDDRKLSSYYYGGPYYHGGYGGGSPGYGTLRFLRAKENKRDKVFGISLCFLLLFFTLSY